MTEKVKLPTKQSHKTIKIGIWDEEEHSRFLKGKSCLNTGVV